MQMQQLDEKDLEQKLKKDQKVLNKFHQELPLYIFVLTWIALMLISMLLNGEVIEARS